MSNVLKALNERPIAYYPIYRKITGSTTAGILLSQLMYWFSIKDKLYKTNIELMQETLLTEGELKGAKSKIKRLPFIEITREGVPAKTFYRIDWLKYEEYLYSQINQTRPVNSSHPVGSNSPNWISQIHPSITKTTTKSTTKSTTESKAKQGKEHLEERRIIDYLNKRVDKKFRDTKSNVSTINSILKDYTLEECLKVIDIKTTEWLSDSKMKQYLTISTLFRESNFDKYLNQDVPTKQTEQSLWF